MLLNSKRPGLTYVVSMATKGGCQDLSGMDIIENCQKSVRKVSEKCQEKCQKSAKKCVRKVSRGEKVSEKYQSRLIFLFNCIPLFHGIFLFGRIETVASIFSTLRDCFFLRKSLVGLWS